MIYCCSYVFRADHLGLDNLSGGLFCEDWFSFCWEQSVASSFLGVKTPENPSVHVGIVLIWRQAEERKYYNKKKVE